MTAIGPIPKRPDSERPPAIRRRYTIRDAKGIPLGHGRTPDEAASRAAGKGVAVWIEERDRDYPFKVWHRVKVGE